MKYRGYEITNEKGHCRITAPDGTQWTEDTIEEAKKSVDGDRLMNADE